MNILVTGSNGFIGHHLVTFLKNKGHNVRGVDIEKDLTNLDNAISATRDIDLVFHMAADVGGIGYLSKEENQRKMIINNMQMGINMLEACRFNKVKKLFFPSSSCIYPTSGIQKEETAYYGFPENLYGWEKLNFETISSLYPEIDIKIGRFQNIYGPESHYNDSREMALVALCRKIINSDKVEIWGNGLQMRNWLYVDDCIEMIYELMQTDCKEPVNIGTDKCINIKDLADLIAKILNKKVEFIFDLSKPTGRKIKTCDNEIRKEYITYEPKVKLEKGIKEVLKWIRSL